MWAGERVYRRRQYKWGFADRLQQIHEAGVGPTQYGHDGLGQLTWAQYPDGSADLRMPDAVGNLFRSQDRSDRKYGPAGQLLEMRTDEGITTYDYDSAGNLIRKHTPRGTWTYHWNGAGRLEQVERPDGDIVRFAYDALGRRISKTFRGETTYWIWDGNNPLHEWRVTDPKAPPAPPALEGADEAASTRRDAEQSANPSTGPPPNPAPEDLITWLFDPTSFAPMAKLVGQDRYAIITDHLGSPIAMADESGNRVWAAEYNPYGQLRARLGDRQACPFRFPGQYEDAETGLYYNRFRYYDPAAGQYTAQDPIGLAGGLALYGYVHDTLTWLDPLGLSGTCGAHGGRIPDDAFVVRGGVATEAQIAKGIGPHRDVPGLEGFSAQARTGASVEELAATGGVGNGPFPHGQVSVTTAGKLREVGCDVVPSPGGGANHVTVIPGGATPAKIAEQFSQQPNPARRK